MRIARLCAALMVGGSLLLGSLAYAADLPRKFDDLRDAAAENLIVLARQNDLLWERSKARDVDFNLRRGTIRWEFDNGLALARVELLGVWARESGVMIWGWSHPLAPRGTAVSSAKVRRYAKKHGIEELTRPEIACDPQNCKSIAGIAALVGKLAGVHSVELTPGETMAYLGFARVKEIKENGR